MQNLHGIEILKVSVFRQILFLNVYSTIHL